jgi:secondary thiamine-phosphate synthase enzyme
MWFRKILEVATDGRGTIEVTDQVAAMVHTSGIGTGLCHVFNRHTSASLVLCENADPAVRRDLETYFAGLVVDGDPRFSHNQEGDDDMAAHIRTILTTNSLSIPVEHERLMLGTWQGIYLWEHRTSARRRELVVTVYGN